jgi:multiple sugar transport system substrate-binding protein
VTYAIPNGAESPRVLFYNKAKWADAGLPLPNDLEAKGQWTWDAFAQHMTKVTTQGAQKNWGFSAQLGVHPEPHSFISSNNGKTLTDDLQTFVGADNKDTIEALQLQSDLIQKYKVAPPPGEDLGPGDTFLSGRMASMITGIWAAAPLFVRPDFDYAVAPLPKSAKGVRKTVVKPNALTIPVGVQGAKAAAAWELIKYVSGPDFQKALIDVGQVMTNHKSLVDYFNQKSPVRNNKVFTDAYDKKEVVPIPLIPKWADYRGVVDEEMTKVRKGELNVQTALGNVKSRTADLLKS